MVKEHAVVCYRSSGRGGKLLNEHGLCQVLDEGRVRIEGGFVAKLECRVIEIYFVLCTILV